MDTQPPTAIFCEKTCHALNELQQRAQAQSALNAIAEILNRPLEITQSLARVCQQITSILGMESVVIHRLDASARRLIILAHHGLSPQLVAQVQQLDLDDPAIIPLVRNGRALAMNDVTDFPVLTSLVGPRAEGYHAGIGVPILQRGKPVGTLYVGSKIKTRYHQSDVDLLQNIANQIGVALENADLYARMQQRVAELEGLAQLSATYVAQHDAQTICNQAVELTKKLLQANVCVLCIIEGDQLCLRAACADSPLTFRATIELDALRQVIDERQTVVVSDAQAADLPPRHQHEFQRLGWRAFLAVPLVIQARVIGILAVAHHQPRVWLPNEIELVQTIANQTGVALEHARLDAQMQQRLQELEALIELSAALVSQLDAQAVATIAAEWIYRLFHVDVVDLSLLREGKLYALAQRVTYPEARLDAPIELGDLTRYLAERQEVLLIHDIEHDAHAPALARQLMCPRGLRSLLVIPLVTRQQMIGTLAVVHAQPRVWSLRERELLQTIANYVASALDNAQLYQNALTEKRKVQAIFDSGLSGLFVTDAQGRVVMFNRAAERITGWRLEDLQGKDWHAFLSDYAAGNEIPSLLEQALRHKTTLFAFEGRKLRTKDGRVIPVARAAAPLLDEKDNVIGAVGAFWDLSKELRAEMVYKNFLAMLTHQIRSPLTAILSALELFERPSLSDARRAELWALIKTEGDHLKRLAEQFLTHQRIIQSGKQIDLETFALAPLVRQTVRKFRLRCPTYHFHTHIPNPDIYVHANTQYVTDILQNLLDNAVVYSPRSRRINIRVGAENSDWVIVSVQDFGVGIPLSEQQYLFQPFYRVPQTSERRVYGHGLGLSIVKEMVEAMGGTVWLESDSGKGATFYFTLRRAQ